MLEVARKYGDRKVYPDNLGANKCQCVNQPKDVHILAVWFRAKTKSEFHPDHDAVYVGRDKHGWNPKYEAHPLRVTSLTVNQSAIEQDTQHPSVVRRQVQVNADVVERLRRCIMSQ
jgi:hypothetical protein